MVDGTILLTGNTYLCFVQVNSLETSQVAWLDMLASWANKESGLLNISIGVVCIGAPTLVLDAIMQTQILGMVDGGAQAVHQP